MKNNINALANASYEINMNINTPEAKEVKDNNAKIAKLYEALKRSIPEELHGLLFEYDNLQGDTAAIIEENAYLKGFKDAMQEVTKTKAHPYFIRVDYEEFEPDTYKGVVLTHGDTEVLRINTGDFKADLATMDTQYLMITEGENVFTSSSVDNYSMDSTVTIEEV
jgi:hypothetical protein